MQKIGIADRTLCRTDRSFSFKEKIEIARKLEALGVNAIDLPEIEDEKADSLLIRTLSSILTDAVLTVKVGNSKESIQKTAAALKDTSKGMLRIELPASPVGMEYNCHMRAPKMLAWVEEAILLGKSLGFQVEYDILDATRAENEFLSAVIEKAVLAGVDRIVLWDSAGNRMPDEFADFVNGLKKQSLEKTGKEVAFGVSCINKNGLALAQSILAVRKGINSIKTTVAGELTSLRNFSAMIHNIGQDYDMTTTLEYVNMQRILKQIYWITDQKQESSIKELAIPGDYVPVDLNQYDDQEAVNSAIAKLGYDLSEEDQKRVYEEFLRVAKIKPVGMKELDAIIASTALQVPETYQLQSYLINNGSSITSSAQVILVKDGKQIQGVCLGDGPIDAAIRAIEQLIGVHYMLDDFQLQAITEGQEAVGSAVIKIRANGRVYSGNGVSTDIIEAGIKAYMNAVNKIIYEEA